MKKFYPGFTLIELLIVMAIMGFVLAVSGLMAMSMARTYTQQSKVAESNVEGVIGLEILQRDIASAGYGLPWALPPGTTYQEAIGAVPALFNDAPSSAPRAVVTADNMAVPNILAGSDYLVLRAANLAPVKDVTLPPNDACRRWQYLMANSSGNPIIPPQADGNDNLDVNDRVIVINPGSPAAPATQRQMVGPAPLGNMSTAPLTVGNITSAQADPEANRMIYGIDNTVAPRMPFNRADYFVSTNPAIRSSGRCAPNTGVLVKAIVSQANGAITPTTTLPLLDCVADMQVQWVGQSGCIPPLPATALNDAAVLPLGVLGPPLCTAQMTRQQLQELRVYILTHEGGMDRSYRYQAAPPDNIIRVGDPDPANAALGRNFDLAANIGATWRNYRWKIYTIVVRPENLR